MQEYKITKDGFGIHTFELSIPALRKKEMDEIMERILNEPLNRIYEIPGKSFCIHTKYPCLRIYLNHKKHMRYIRVIVTAKKVIYPEADYISILNENDDIALIGEKLNDMLTDILGSEYGFDIFSLSRIDCCVNIMLSKDFSAERYVKLISRSLYCEPDMIEKYDGNDELSKNRNRHSFRVRTNFGAFTAYDKYFQLEDIDADFNTISDALLRLELEYDRKHIHNTAGDDWSNAYILEFYLHNSRNNFREFVSSRFAEGRYYTVSEMHKIIDDSNLKKCEKKHARKHIELQCYMKYYRDALLNSKKKIKSEKAFYNMLANFNYLGISPISLSYRDKHCDNSLPDLYELLDFKKDNS